MIDLPSRALAARMRGLAASLPFAGELKDKFDEEILSAEQEEIVEYPSYLEYSGNEYKSAGEAEIELPLAEAVSSSEKVFEETDGKNALIWNEEEYFEWDIDVKTGGLYELWIEYYPLEGKGVEIQRKIRIDGEYPKKNISMQAVRFRDSTRCHCRLRSWNISFIPISTTGVNCFRTSMRCTALRICRMDSFMWGALTGLTECGRDGRVM